jgi:hypothetical protein
MMARITISYRRKDNEEMAGRIRDCLVTHHGDDSVFMDIYNIPIGQDFRSHIREAVSQSDILVVIIGRRWLGAAKNRRSRIEDEIDSVRLEVETALEAHVRIFPVLIGAARMPKAEQLPESLKDFAFINAATVDTGLDFHPHIERLIRSLDRHSVPEPGRGLFGPGQAVSCRRHARTVVSRSD